MSISNFFAEILTWFLSLIVTFFAGFHAPEVSTISFSADEKSNYIWECELSADYSISLIETEFKSGKQIFTFEPHSYAENYSGIPKPVIATFTSTKGEVKQYVFVQSRNVANNLCIEVYEPGTFDIREYTVTAKTAVENACWSTEAKNVAETTASPGAEKTFCLVEIYDENIESEEGKNYNITRDVVFNYGLQDSESLENHWIVSGLDKNREITVYEESDMYIVGIPEITEQEGYIWTVDGMFEPIQNENFNNANNNVVTIHSGTNKQLSSVDIAPSSSFIAFIPINSGVTRYTLYKISTEDVNNNIFDKYYDHITYKVTVDDNYNVTVVLDKDYSSVGSLN